MESEYVEAVRPDKKFPGAFSGMLAALDRSSAYLDAEKTSLWRLHSKYGTCVTGIHGTKSVDYFMVIDVDKGSTAETAGIKPGHLIKSINGKSLYGLSFWEMYLSLVTEKPALIELISIQEGSTDPVKTTFQTTPVPRPALLTKKLKKDVMLIELPLLNTESAQLLKKRLENEAAKQKKPLKLILDLRKYRDGDVNGLVMISRLFFKKEFTLTLKSKAAEEIIQLGSPNALQHRTTVIVNASTIMYGELLAALFKAEYGDDPGRVTLVGNKTRGMISKLKHIPLADGSSVLITQGLYLREGVDVSKSGTAPDVKLDLMKTQDITKQCITILKKPLKKPHPLKKDTNK